MWATIFTIWIRWKAIGNDPCLSYSMGWGFKLGHRVWTEFSATLIFDHYCSIEILFYQPLETYFITRVRLAAAIIHSHEDFLHNVTYYVVCMQTLLNFYQNFSFCLPLFRTITDFHCHLVNRLIQSRLSHRTVFLMHFRTQYLVICILFC